MTAANILREKARKTENVSSAAFAPTSPDLLRAVAELMEAAKYHDYVVIAEKLAALERLIEGERDD